MTEGAKKGEKMILAESSAIQRYIAREFKLDGADKYEQALVDMIATNAGEDCPDNRALRDVWTTGVSTLS
jgi:hypothetical protein